MHKKTLMKSELFPAVAILASLELKNCTAVVVCLFWNLMMTSIVRMKKKAKQATTAKTLKNFTMTFILGILNHKA